MKYHVFSLAVICGSCTTTPGPVVPKTAIERQMIGLLEKFDRWDDDGDGQLDSNELTHGIGTLRGKTQQVTYTAAEILDFYDTNHDSKVSLREAQAGYRRSDEAESRVKL